MALIAKLDILLGTNTRGLDKGFKRGRSQVKSFGDSFKKLGGIIAGVAAAYLSFTALRRLGGFISEQLQAIDVIGKTSAKLGIETEELTKLHHAAERTGVSIKTFNMALQRVVRRISEAAGGRGEALGAILELGLDPKQLAAVSPDEAFRKLAEAMQRVDNQFDRVRLSQKLFDSEGVALVNTLALGRKGLEAMGDEAQRLGRVLDSDAVKAVEAANDAMDDFKASLTAVGTGIALDLAPFLKLAANDLTDISVGLRTSAKSAGIADAEFSRLQRTIFVLVDVFQEYKKIMTSISIVLYKTLLLASGVAEALSLKSNRESIVADIKLMEEALENMFKAPASEVLMDRVREVRKEITKLKEEGKDFIDTSDFEKGTDAIDEVTDKLSELAATATRANEALRLPQRIEVGSAEAIQARAMRRFGQQVTGPQEVGRGVAQQREVEQQNKHLEEIAANTGATSATLDKIERKPQPQVLRL